MAAKVWFCRLAKRGREILEGAASRCGYDRANGRADFIACLD